MKLYNAKITEISDKGVKVTGYRLEEPNPDDYLMMKLDYRRKI